MPPALNGLAKRALRVKTEGLMVDDTIIQFRGNERPQPRNDEAGDAPSRGAEVMFDRRELSTILSLYGRMVAAGEWRDYAIGAGREHAVFAVFRHTAEMPLYRIEKNPLPWLDEMLNAAEHTNFFENRATEYSKASTTGSWEDAFADSTFTTAQPDGEIAVARH